MDNIIKEMLICLGYISLDQALAIQKLATELDSPFGEVANVFFGVSENQLIEAIRAAMLGD